MNTLMFPVNIIRVWAADNQEVWIEYTEGAGVPSKTSEPLYMFFNKFLKNTDLLENPRRDGFGQMPGAHL